jgi:CxxC-x17-CxxC domain-containing protein
MASITQTCISCSRQFLIIDAEQKFLREKNLPNPTQCFSCRQARRLALRSERNLYKTTCQKCGKEIIVAFDPQKTQNAIYCKIDYDAFFMENDPIIKDPLPEN